MMYIANIYEHNGRQFLGNWHATRKQCLDAGEFELSIEPKTRLAGRIAVRGIPYTGDVIRSELNSWS